MGMARLEQQYHPDRLRYPLQRLGQRGEGKWQRISWDRAYELVAEQLRIVGNKYGLRSLAFFTGSGAAGVLTKGSVQRFAAAIGGTAYRAGGVDYGVPKALEYTFGIPASTYFRPGGHEYADAVNSQLILLWGGNAADTRLVDFHFILEAQRRGAKIVCIDPNRSATAQQADQWISPRPGTDTALALALLNEIIAQDLHDREFLVRHTNAAFLVRCDNGALLRTTDIKHDAFPDYLVWDSSSGETRSAIEASAPALTSVYQVTTDSGATIDCQPSFELLQQLCAEYSVERAAPITGIPADTIRRLAREFANAKPAAIRIGYGVDRWYYADYTARAVANLIIATGNIGIPGGGISVHDGTYSAPLNLQPFRTPGGREAATLDIIGLMQAIEHGKPYPVKSLWLSASNMFNQTSANRSRVLREILPKLELLVVVEQFMTDTAALADIVLPACTIFEKNDLIAAMFLQLQRQAVAPEGESKADWDIMTGLAQRLGLGQYFERPPEDYLREMLDSDDGLIKGITLERLQREDAVLLNRPAAPYVGFADMRFKTPSGRIEIYKEELLRHGAELPYYHEPIEASPKNPSYSKYPLTLLFSHSRHRIHSTFANLSRAKQHEPEPLVEIAPNDAARRGLTDGQLVRVYNQRGRVELKCRLNGDLRPGVVVIAEGSWVKDFPKGEPYSLTHEQVSPTSDNYAFFDTLVEIELAGDEREDPRTN
jgi:molybdopterin-containing oxidoreductase family molybdopterin binding subunit